MKTKEATPNEKKADYPYNNCCYSFALLLRKNGSGPKNNSRFRNLQQSGIESAMNTVIKEFRKSFDGCELFKIEYGDEATLREAKNYGSGKVMVLLSEFETGCSFDESLEPNSKYSDYKWVLVRTKLGGWKLEDQGYA